jgi:hypothetical protein
MMSANWFGEFLTKHTAPIQEENEEELVALARRRRLGIEDHEEDCKCLKCWPPDFDDRGD